MSYISTFTIQRPDGHTVVTGVPAQVDDISPQVIASAGGAIPNNSFQWISLFPSVDIQQGDLALDENNTDTKGRAVQYRVSGSPEPFDDHVETVITRYVGNTP